MFYVLIVIPAVMVQIKQVIRQMISVSDHEMSSFLEGAVYKYFKRNETVSREYVVPNEIYFINKGLLRVLIRDNEGSEHSIHFAMENQFIVDYSAFLKQEASHYCLQALEETELISIPRSSIEWGYKNMQEGQKLGRLIAEYYYIYQDERIKNNYIRTPKERYDSISEVFPNIHNRVPQHMIASYLGISSVHLSRLKKP